jgi:hypothetical protein
MKWLGFRDDRKVTSARSTGPGLQLRAYAHSLGSGSGFGMSKSECLEMDQV